ncbi:MAG: pyridoxal-5'-phosphate-dependent protein subunit beta, partial [Acetobacteraceae bacterium]|nr:pyridoxal-5'-phosphate-dependent protein subunit beta [Acetobacteraceae bacterium]
MYVSYLDPRSGESYPLDAPRWCGGTSERPAPLLLTPLPGIGRDAIDAGTR